METNLKGILKAYFGAGSFFTIFGEGVTLYLYSNTRGFDPDWSLPALIGFGVPALPFGLMLAGRVARMARPPEQYNRRPSATTRALANTVDVVGSWLMPQPKAPANTAWGLSDTTQPTTAISLRSVPKRQEFVFYEPGMRAEVTESRLFSFCAAAWRRQQRVYYGNLAANKVFSRSYFTTEARPRYPMPDYQSIMHILDSRDLVTNRFKGGELVHNPSVTVEEAKARWVDGYRSVRAVQTIEAIQQLVAA